MSAGWYPIALSLHLPPGVAAPVRLAGRELVLWRTAEGEARVFADRCPHRGMRLSFGFVRDDTLVCLYHGWRWGADAACRAIPAHPDLAPPRSLCAETFPVLEADGVIWSALAPPDGPPPPVPAGATPVASLACARPAGRSDFVARGEGARAHWIAAQPVEAATSLLHVLAAHGSDPRAVLDAAQADRDALERQVRAA